MRAKGGNTGGKYLAIERGLFPGWSGWPFPGFPHPRPRGKKKRRAAKRLLRDLTPGRRARVGLLR